MSENTEIKKFVEHKAFKLRELSLLMTTAALSGHPTSCLSSADLVAALFFYALHYDPHNFDNPNNDRFILSKGHAAPLLYAAWQQTGAFTSQELLTYRAFGSALQGHPTPAFKYAEAATGSLGMGLSIGAGMALAAKMDHRDYRAYVLLGDAELAEGSIWEAAELASHYHLNNLVAIVDCNRLGQSTQALHGHHVERYAKKFEAFGWKAFIIDGHDVAQIMHAYDKARQSTDAPVVIIAKTFKGHGVQLFENKEGYHGKALNEKDLAVALHQLEQNYPHAKQYTGTYQWQPHLPLPTGEQIKSECVSATLPDPTFEQGKSLATRKAYGMALTALGRVCPQVISLDAEVKNSTCAELFEDRFPERFVQCFIAEQNMVSMGVGLERRDKMPFISTFSAFFSRAYDQIRMAAIGGSSLRLVGSHCGVSIGQDGPSQMGLEDIALMRALPNSIVLYPCDGVSTYRLVGLMAEYNKGISYLRTTRKETPELYPWHEQFVVGGCKVLRSSERDVACIVAAGVTVHEALKAYEQLRNQGIAVAVIDAYSVKPLDAATIIDVAQKAGNRIVTVEDHYLEGGLGQAVAYAVRNTGITVDCLAVTQVPGSGTPEELLAWAGIDAAAIVKKILAKQGQEAF